MSLEDLLIPNLLPSDTKRYSKDDFNILKNIQSLFDIYQIKFLFLPICFVSIKLAENGFNNILSIK